MDNKKKIKQRALKIIMIETSNFSDNIKFHMEHTDIKKTLDNKKIVGFE